MRVGEEGGPPDVGEDAIKVSTDTVASAAGDVESIDTRLPPLPDLHEKDLADVLGKEPVVLAFATPQLCQTRVCGPVVDVVAEVKNEVGDGITFIHQEIYNENDINKGFRPQVGAVAPAHRALDVPHRPRRQGRRAVRGRRQRRRAVDCREDSSSNTNAADYQFLFRKLDGCPMSSG